MNYNIENISSDFIFIALDYARMRKYNSSIIQSYNAIYLRLIRKYGVVLSNTHSSYQRVKN